LILVRGGDNPVIATNCAMLSRPLPTIFAVFARYVIPAQAGIQR